LQHTKKTGKNESANNNKKRDSQNVFQSRGCFRCGGEMMKKDGALPAGVPGEGSPPKAHNKNKMKKQLKQPK